MAAKTAGLAQLAAVLSDRLIRSFTAQAYASRRHSLRAVCWHTKTTKRGQPFAVRLHGISGRDPAGLWVLPFLRAVQTVWERTEEIYCTHNLPRLHTAHPAQPAGFPKQASGRLPPAYVVQPSARGNSPELLTPEEASAFTLHSLKVCLLSAGAQIQAADKIRQQQGHHKNPSPSVQLYGRDDTLGALALQTEITQACALGWRPSRPIARGGQHPTVEPPFSVSSSSPPKSFQLSALGKGLDRFIYSREAELEQVTFDTQPATANRADTQLQLVPSTAPSEHEPPEASSLPPTIPADDIEALLVESFAVTQADSSDSEEHATQPTLEDIALFQNGPWGSGLETVEDLAFAYPDLNSFDTFLQSGPSQESLALSAQSTGGTSAFICDTIPPSSLSPYGLTILLAKGKVRYKEISDEAEVRAEGPFLETSKIIESRLHSRILSLADKAAELADGNGPKLFVPRSLLARTVSILRLLLLLSFCIRVWRNGIKDSCCILRVAWLEDLRLVVEKICKGCPNEFELVVFRDGVMIWLAVRCAKTRLVCWSWKLAGVLERSTDVRTAFMLSAGIMPKEDGEAGADARCSDNRNRVTLGARVQLGGGEQTEPSTFRVGSYCSGSAYLDGTRRCAQGNTKGTGKIGDAVTQIASQHKAKEARPKASGGFTGGCHIMDSDGVERKLQQGGVNCQLSPMAKRQAVAHDLYPDILRCHSLEFQGSTVLLVARAYNERRSLLMLNCCTRLAIQNRHLVGHWRFCTGEAVRLRHCYVVRCTTLLFDDAGEVTAIQCECDFDSLAVTGGENKSNGPGPNIVSWVAASCDLHVQAALHPGPADLVAAHGHAVGPILCEPWLAALWPELVHHRGLPTQDGYHGTGADSPTDSSKQSKFGGVVQLERLGEFRICQIGGSFALQCVKTWVPKTPPKPGKRQRVPTAVHEATALASAARKQAMKDAASYFSLEEPLLLMCACDRWERVLALDLREAWCDAAQLEEVGQGLFRLRVKDAALSRAHPARSKSNSPEPPLLREGTFKTDNVWHVAGLRRCLRLLTTPGSQNDLVAEAGKMKLDFPSGWSLEHEGPYQPRYESLAPYAQSCGFMSAQLGRAIAGPLRETGCPEDAADTARVVTVQIVGREDLFLLAQDDLGFDAFSPTEFGTSWRARPFPDYSAALEPLAALAMLGLGLRLHQRLWSEAPRAFLDATCGTGTLAAAAKYCQKDWPIFAGDVNPTLARRARINLEAAFPKQTFELTEPSEKPVPGIGVREWDATEPWPIPATAAVSSTGRGLLVASNLPWGKNLKCQVEAATLITRCLARSFPDATLCLVAPEEVARNCDGWFRTVFTEPVGKKAALMLGHGICEPS
ncbi:CPY1 [Symbiodinium sp. CCMP2592]|nr:CPY1 [Symbiodinium sp. CCMP2592]